MNSSNTNKSTIIRDNDENEDEIKRYIDKEGLNTILAVFEGDYVRFAKELQNRESELDEEKVMLQEDFEKMIEQEGWRKELEE
jgi:hypothetical protein